MNRESLLGDDTKRCPCNKYADRLMRRQVGMSQQVRLFGARGVERGSGCDEQAFVHGNSKPFSTNWLYRLPNQQRVVVASDEEKELAGIES